MLDSPCHHCENRHKNCHGDCPKYAEYCFDGELRRMTRRIDYDIVDYTIREIQKRKVRKNEKNSIRRKRQSD